MVMTVAAMLLMLTMVPIQPALAFGSEWKSCPGDAAAEVFNVSIDSVPTAGQPFSIILEGSVGLPVQSATLDVAVAYLGFTVHRQHGSICEALPCPMAPGDFQVTLPAAMPSLAPHGTYTLTISSTLPSTQQEPLFGSLPRAATQGGTSDARTRSVETDGLTSGVNSDGLASNELIRVWQPTLQVDAKDSEQLRGGRRSTEAGLPASATTSMSTLTNLAHSDGRHAQGGLVVSTATGPTAKSWVNEDKTTSTPSGWSARLFGSTEYAGGGSAGVGSWQVPRNLLGGANDRGARGTAHGAAVTVNEQRQLFCVAVTFVLGARQET